MAGPSKQQKIMTVSIVILLDDALQKNIHKKKENPRDFGCVNCLKKGKLCIFACVNKGTKNAEPGILFFNF